MTCAGTFGRWDVRTSKDIRYLRALSPGSCCRCRATPAQPRRGPGRSPIRGACDPPKAKMSVTFPLAGPRRGLMGLPRNFRSVAGLESRVAGRKSVNPGRSARAPAARAVAVGASGGPSGPGGRNGRHSSSPRLRAFPGLRAAGGSGVPFPGLRGAAAAVLWRGPPLSRPTRGSGVPARATRGSYRSCCPAPQGPDGASR